MKITSTSANTCWAFLSGSADARHLSDVVFGVDALRKRGVPDTNIWIFTDHPVWQAHLSPYGIQNVRPARAILTQLANLTGFDLVMVVVTGHGDRAGISVLAGPSINPTELMGAARACPGIKGGAIILGQCFAGLFNFTNAGTTAPPLCVVGATNLNASLSSPLGLKAPVKQLDGSDGLMEWQANIFMAHFFDWLMSPRDVDGDGSFTLMDAYKHASVECNQAIWTQKQSLHTTIVKLESEIVTLSQQLQSLSTQAAPGQPPSAQLQQTVLAISAKQVELNQSLEILYLHQEPWVLHALFAARIEFVVGAPVTVALPAATAASTL